MRSQWECLLQNLGEWQGSFTHFSPAGEQLEDIPSVLNLEQVNDNQTVRLTLRRFPPNQPVKEQVLEFTNIGRNIMFCDSGAFSQGSMQWAPFSQFGAELALIEGNRRLRLVQMFNRERQLSSLTLIREQLAGINAPECPLLTWEQLLGEWQGEAVTMYPDLRSPETYATHLKLQQQDNNHLVQQLRFGTGTSVRTITSTARIDGSMLYFDQSTLPVQVLLLPDGASSNCPREIKPGHRFVLEVGWLYQPNHRQRLIRSYSDKGELLSLTLVKEEKVKTS
ncbi:MAG: DUF3598 family protein [Symploca sp. SIO1A3]|nr:DUF3598 family protein [Symploca sp. SIO2C1]NER51068.1 DUF3598 family protein [Symploca sp. SIO1A3]